ncbi:PASTA domain-containing protein [Micromonospora sp. NPDC004704]
MTDGNASWQTSSPVEQPDRPRRGAMVAGAAVATVLLATIGAIGGWALANSEGSDPTTGAGPEATSSIEPSPTKTKTRPPTSPPKTAPTSKAPAGQFALPDLTGQSFERVRQDLRELGLGWTLMFGDSGEDPTVVRTDPPANTNVRKGTSVKVYVSGAAPMTDVPEVTGLSCDQAKAVLVDAGFGIEYRTGKTGPVLRQEPGPNEKRRWNESIVIYCGSVPNLPGQPTPAAT